MNLPPDFISTITNTFGAEGERFIVNLPALIDEASAHWGLTNIQPVSNLSYNFVAFADSPLPSGEGLGRTSFSKSVCRVMSLPVKYPR